MVTKIEESVASDDEHEIGMPAKDKTEDEIEEDVEATGAMDEGTGDEDHGLSDRESAYESDIGDKEEDFPPIDKAHVTAVHIEILQQVDDGKYPLKTEADKEAFLLKYQKEYLLSRNNEGDSLLHGLLVNVKEDDDAVFTRRIPLLNLLLALDPRIPTVKNDRQETALYVAVHKHLRHVVKYMCERSPDAVEALGIPKTNGDTCLHVAIQKELDFEFLSYLIDQIGKPMLLQKGEGGNTPLHLAVEWERCKPKQVRLVRRLVEASRATLEMKNNENFSPFQYHLATRRRSDPNKRDPTSSRPGLKNGNSSKESFSRYLESKYESKYDVKGRSLPEVLKTKPESRRKRGTAKVSIADAKEVESYLMLQCMHIADREKAIGILYGAVQKRAIEFDLWGRSTISEADLNSMEAYLKFEVILQYVAIPCLTVSRSANQTISNSNSNSNSNTNEIAKLPRKLPDCKGRLDYCLIFDWLRECGVKRILRVIVQDDQAAPHSDEIIELALEGFEIEDFDWQKVDLCTETVLKAAPNAKTVHLYSTGNNAVLRGWSDTGGLQRLKNLEKVYLVTSQGLESEERTLENVRSFKERLLQLCPKVKVIDKVMKVVSVTQDTSVSESQIAQDKQKQKWLDCMDDFATFILNYPKEPQERIKVALIDDGVDTAFQDLSRNIASGVSYYKRTNGLYSSYYQSSGGHGTVMASLIRRICPHVRIYVAKLDEKLTATSAAKAVRWAITMGVHIISMSWTIQRTPKNAREIDDLEKAITAADRKNILLFCSASDQGNSAKKDQSQNYPAKAKPDKIFQIGAATASGKGWEWLGHGHVDFIFPGEKLLLQTKLGGALPDTLSGSSLATALAAGMAALILHCAEVQNHADLALLKNYESMKDAFIAVGVSECYVLVWETFDISKDDFKSESDILRGVVSKLLNKNMYGLNRAPTVEFK